MFKGNEYFDGRVKSIAFQVPDGPATGPLFKVLRFRGRSPSLSRGKAFFAVP